MKIYIISIVRRNDRSNIRNIFLDPSVGGASVHVPEHANSSRLESKGGKIPRTQQNHQNHHEDPPRLLLHCRTVFL